MRSLLLLIKSQSTFLALILEVFSSQVHTSLISCVTVDMHFHLCYKTYPLEKHGVHIVRPPLKNYAITKIVNSVTKSLLLLIQGQSTFLARILEVCSKHAILVRYLCVTVDTHFQLPYRMLQIVTHGVHIVQTHLRNYVITKIVTCVLKIHLLQIQNQSFYCV